MPFAIGTLFQRLVYPMQVSFVSVTAWESQCWCWAQSKPCTRATVPDLVLLKHQSNISTEEARIS